MGRSRTGSVGSYSSGSADNVGGVLGKYGNNGAQAEIAKVENDLLSAEKNAKKKQKQLEKTAADTKAALEGDAGSSDEDKDDNVGYSSSGPVTNIAAELTKRSPEEIFAQFDTDNSGLIDFDEFRVMLPQLGIKISMPKALRYFRMCDTDGTGEIDLEEFKVAMFAVDPDNGNPVGFTPNTLLAPLDAFQMFDEDNSGQIDEDEFFFLLQFLGLEISEQKQEQMFSKYDADKSGYIEYPEFKKIWARLSNVKKELTDRGVKIPKLATKAMLSKMLEQILDAEEDRERRAMAEAERWAKWQMLLKDKRRAYEKAWRLSNTELKSALDAGGSVWVFGTGAFREFTAPAPKVLTQGGHAFEHYDTIRGIWSTRVKPPAKAAEPIKLGLKHERRRKKEIKEMTDLGNPKPDDETSEESLEMLANNQDNHQDPEEDARTSPFAGLCVAESTSALWGRRIVSVTTSDSAAFAVGELGEGYAWGGKDHWWFEIRPDSHWQTKWRGDTTERSRLLLQTLDKVEQEERKLDEDGDEDEEEKEIEKLRTITMYFGVWKPPPTNQRLAYIKDQLLPRIKHQQVKYSLQCRGKHVEDMNKMELLDLLYDDIVLETKVLGERLHRRIRQLELETLQMLEKGKGVLGRSLRLEIEDMWSPLREIQAEDAVVKRANEESIKGITYAKSEERYSLWRLHMRKTRDDTNLVFTARGNSLAVFLGGITDRGCGVRTPRANDGAVAVTAGSNHVFMVHRSGQLYTWGVGASGRLGLDLLQGGNPQGDAATATVIQAFRGRPVIRASAGFNHSAAITSSGRVFCWGSAATGKLGLGVVDRDVYCSVPTRVMVDTKSKIKEISCGAAHTACVTASGQLFVWGCGDGGRLGLGEERLGVQFEPVLAESLLEERMYSVSCGNSHTLALTAVRETFEGNGAGRAKMRRGGGMFQAGSTNVLGNFCPKFTPVHGLEHHPIKQVSAGYGHSCCVTRDGELYTWGSNRDGCLGLPRAIKFANTPQLVSCLYVSPKNLALGCRTRQSSVYDGLGAELVVDGDCSGNDPRKCNCTQQDPQGWWELDLGELVHLHEVKDFSLSRWGPSAFFPLPDLELHNRNLHHPLGLPKHIWTRKQVNIWNRCDEPVDPSLERSFYAKRLFPCWVMASQEQYDDDVGGAALIEAMNASVARAHLKEEQRCSVWRCPDKTMARYVRVQLEGFDFLHMAQVEVFGTKGARRSPGRVHSSSAGKYVTTAVIAAAEDPADVETAYKKAVQADAFNAEVLRELETFFFAYDEWGRGDSIKGCLLCKAGSLCEICAFKHEFRDEIRDQPLGPGGSVRPLREMAQYLFDREKSNLNYQAPTKKGGGLVNTMRDGISKIFSPLQDSIGDSSASRSNDALDTSSASSSNKNKGSDNRRRRGGGADASDDGTSTLSSTSAPINRRDEEYHVGPLRGDNKNTDSLLSARSASTITTTTSTGSADGSRQDGDSSSAISSASSGTGRRMLRSGASTDRSSAINNAGSSSVAVTTNNGVGGGNLSNGKAMLLPKRSTKAERSTKE